MHKKCLIFLFGITAFILTGCNSSETKSETVVAETKEDSYTGATAKGYKQVLVLSSSPRNGGNSDLLCDEFIKGASEAGHHVEKINLNDKDINFLSVTDYKKADSIADDAPEIVEKMIASDVIVMATPTFFYAMSGQMKTMIDRTYMRHKEISDKDFYFIISAADTIREHLQPVVQEFRGFLHALDRPVERGVIYGTGAWEKASIKESPAMKEAYEMGKSI